jgi:hypothetical protein
MFFVGRMSVIMRERASMKRCSCLIIVATVFAGQAQDATAAAPAQPSLVPELSWPAITRESRPWTRWWWLGSAVDKTNLTRQLTQFRDAGIGGVEICPIYGVRGWEDRSSIFFRRNGWRC